MIVRAAKKGKSISDTVKQVIILRNDLNMPPGKAASQAAHASMAWLTNRLTKLTTRPELYFESFSANLFPAESEWVKGSFTKIVLQASLEDMMHIYYEAQELGLVANLIKDEGRTVFNGFVTVTALAIGPDYSSNIDPLTGDLSLY